MELSCGLFCDTNFFCSLLYEASPLILMEFDNVASANITYREQLKEKIILTPHFLFSL